jgi:hypothetical protein
MTLPPFWRLEGFGDRLDYWISNQGPSDDLITIVVDWTFT